MLSCLSRNRISLGHNTKLQAYYPLAFLAPAPALFFSRWGIIVLILVGGGKKRVQVPLFETSYQRIKYVCGFENYADFTTVNFR